MSGYVDDRPHDSVPLARFLLSAAAAGGVDPWRLAREARLPLWILSAADGVIDSCHVTRIWELTQHALGETDAALAVAGHYRMGALGLYDYLFAAASTLGAGLAACQQNMHLVTTNSTLRSETEPDESVTYSFRHSPRGDRRTDLAQRCAVVMFSQRARVATGRRFAPVRVGFAHPAPGNVRRLAERLGTSAIDFNVPVTSFTLRAEDLELPMSTSDPALADILARYAASLPRPRAGWAEQFRQSLADAIMDGAPSIEEVARRMAVGKRTLQRRLASQGTTWREQLDAARQERAVQVHRAGVPTKASLAAKLGYSDVRSVSRALHRWEACARDRAASTPRG